MQAEHAHVAGRRTAVSLEGLDRRGLARAVRTEDDEDFAGVGSEVYPVDRRRYVRAAVAHGEPSDLDGWHGVAGYFDKE